MTTALRRTPRSLLLSAHKRLQTNENVHLEAFVSRSLELMSMRNSSSRSLEYLSPFHTCSPTRDSEGQSKAAMKAAPDHGGLQMLLSVSGQCAESRQTRVGTNKQSHQRWVDAKKLSRTLNL